MKAYLTKLVIVAASTIVLLAIPAYAAEQKPILKLEEAVQSAISSSNQAAINSNQYEALKEQMKVSQGADYYQYQSIYLKKAKNEQQKQLLEDRITSDITSKYNAMIVLENEIEGMYKSIGISVKELRQAELKSQKGLMNPVLYQSKQNEIETLKTSIKAKEEELQNAKLYFKVLTGKDMAEYILEETISYEPFKIEGLVEGYINSKISTYLQYDKEIAKFEQDNIIKDGDPTPFYANYLNTKTAADTAVLQLDDKQITLKQTLINQYTSLLSLEDQISGLQLQLEVLDKTLRSAELKYQAGMISVLEYDKQQAKKQEIELQLLKLKNSYGSLKDMIQKPWTAG